MFQPGLALGSKDLSFLAHVFEAEGRVKSDLLFHLLSCFRCLLFDSSGDRAPRHCHSALLACIALGGEDLPLQLSLKQAGRSNEGIASHCCPVFVVMLSSWRRSVHLAPAILKAKNASSHQHNLHDVPFRDQRPPLACCL